MSYTVSELITKAWNLSGIVSKGLQTVSGDQQSEGLDLLNELLAIKTANNRLIPYFMEYDLTAVVAQEKYFIPNLILAETMTFNIGPVRYSMNYKTRKVYFGTARVDGITSLPFDWHLERTLGGANIYVYFVPSTDYPMTLWGKFGLMNVTMEQDLELTLDDYYIAYLRYALAEKMCSEYNIMYQPQAQKKLDEIEQMITDISPLDLATTKISSFTDTGGLNWGDVNVGRGWRP